MSDNPIDTIQRIEQDFEQREPPFDGVEFPEQRLLRELPHTTMEERARFVTAFCTFDYNRDANQLVDNLIELYERKPTCFNPSSRPHKKEVLETYFDDIGFRYPHRDARGWAVNCQILSNEYNGRVTELILSESSNAPELVERIEDDGFLYLKGAKIAPMYARIISDEVAPLNDMWQLEIPVDTWVRKITQEITDTDMSDDDIRAWWGVVGERADVNRHMVDGGVWQIGNNLNEWGEDYLKEVADIDEFEYL